MCKLILTTALTICLTGAAQAAVTNGGFETHNFNGWSLTNSTGRASVVSTYDPSGPGSWSPNEGSYFALLKTDGDGSFCTLSQTFDASAGDTLSFSYFFDYRDYGSADDKSYGRLYDSNNSLVIEFFNWGEDGTLLSDYEKVPSLGGWSPQTYTFSASGDYKIKFGIANDYDSSYDSYMGVDSVKLTSPEPSQSVIPAPGAILLGSIGACLVGWLRRRRTL